MPAATKSASTAPERSLTQRMEALKRANDDQDQAGEAEEGPAGGPGSNPQALLLSPPEYILTAKVSEMLLAVPKYGQVKVNKILAQCRISPSKTIGGLSPRQRAELVSYPAEVARRARATGAAGRRTVRREGCSSSPVPRGSARAR